MVKEDGGSTYSGHTNEYHRRSAGRWRGIAVQVGAHEPPPPHAVPPQMHDYARQPRRPAGRAPREPDELWLETLAYAEGRLLSVHPFQDFNGRVTRLFLLPAPAAAQPAAGGSRARRRGWCGRVFVRVARRRPLDWRPLMRVWRQRLAAPLP